MSEHYVYIAAFEFNGPERVTGTVATLSLQPTLDLAIAFAVRSISRRMKGDVLCLPVFSQHFLDYGEALERATALISKSSDRAMKESPNTAGFVRRLAELQK